MNSRSTLLALAAAALCAATAAAQDASDPRLGAPVDRLCTGRAITGFSNATETSVVVETGSGQFYLITTEGRCDALRDARQLGFNQDSLCLSAGDALLSATATPMASGHMSRHDEGTAPRYSRAIGACQIDAIYEWTPGQSGAGSAAER